MLSAEVNSNKFDHGKTDWRQAGDDLDHDWTPCTLPAQVEEGLLRIAGALDMTYGAADLIETPDGQYVFLEMNPAGEFVWLQELAGLPIYEALAEALLGKARQTRDTTSPTPAHFPRRSNVAPRVTSSALR